MKVAAHKVHSLEARAHRDATTLYAELSSLSDADFASAVCDMEVDAVADHGFHQEKDEAAALRAQDIYFEAFCAAVRDIAPEAVERLCSGRENLGRPST